MRALLCALLLGISAAAWAGSGEEQIPVGPRPLALGGAFRAVDGGADAIYWNPAALASLRVSSLRATNADLHGLGIQDNLLGLVAPWGDRFGVGLEWYHSGFDDGDLEDALDRLQLGIGYAPIPRLQLGAAAKYRQYKQVYEGQDMGRGSGLGLDLGGRVILRRNLSVGLTVQDLGGSTLEYDDGSANRPYDAQLGAGVAYSPLPSLLLAADLDRDAHAGVEWRVLQALDLRAGWTKDLDGLDDARLAAGFGLRYGPLQLDYAFQDHPMLDATHRFALRVDFTLAPRLVEIHDAHLEPLFASSYLAYGQRPVGELLLRSLSDEPVEAIVRVDQSQWMDGPTEQVVHLLPGVVQRVPLNMVLSDRVLRLGESQPTPVEIELVYQSSGRRRSEQRQLRPMLYRAGLLHWGEGVDGAAAFITPDHPAIADFTRRVLLATPQHERALLGNRRASVAMRLFDGMSALGMRYTPDPLNPFSELRGGRFAVDSIQYPAQLLTSRTGDCDDTTVLFASMLENVGIPTALIDVPGHIYLMLDTGIPARDRAYLGVAPELFVERGGSLWIPVETTKLGEAFHVAWQSGADLYHRFAETKSVSVVSTLDARAQHPSANMAVAADAASPPIVDAAEIDGFVQSDMAVVDEWRQAELARFEDLTLDEDSTESILAVARVYYRDGDHDLARDELTRVEESRRGAAVWNNLGVTHLVLGAETTALASFTRARLLDPEDPGIALNRALALHILGKDPSDEFAAAVDGAPGVEAAMQLLGLRAAPEEMGRGDESLAAERLSLEEIESLLRSAVKKVPERSIAAVDSALLWSELAAARDSAGTAEEDVLDSTKVAPDDPRRIETTTAATRGTLIQKENLIDLLYWRERP